jgi:hypothetical protein
VEISKKSLSCCSAALLLCCTIFGCKEKVERKIPPEPLRKPVESVMPDSIKLPVNTPPEIISVKLTPSSPKKGDTIKAEVATKDAENNRVEVSYKWAKNDVLLPETSDTLSIELKRGDKISLTVTPFDGKLEGTPKTVSTYVFNSPPKVLSAPGESKFENGYYTYQVRAIDPDEDKLSYKLKSNQPGMNIDEATGLITWKVEKDLSGKRGVSVLISDSRGGETLHDYYIEITPQ